METPGFGWTSDMPSVSKESRVIIDPLGGRTLQVNDIVEGIPGDLAIQYCKDHNIEYNMTSLEFSERINIVLDYYFDSIPPAIKEPGSLFLSRDSENLSAELSELRLLGTSNGRSLKWDIMHIKPNTSFRLHAHPNIEIIYVLDGAIYEYRYQVSVQLLLLLYFSNRTSNSHFRLLYK